LSKTAGCHLGFAWGEAGVPPGWLLNCGGAFMDDNNGGTESHHIKALGFFLSPRVLEGDIEW